MTTMTSRLITQKPIRYQFVISLENGKIGAMVVAINKSINGHKDI